MTMIIGHCGARNLWAGNSVTGFRNVLELGVGAVELDLHLSDSGEILVIHDATLDRTTDSSGPVRILTPKQRKTVRLKGPAGLTEDTVPSLGEVLDILAPASGVLLHVEIKHDENKKAYAGLAERAADMLRSYKVADRSWLTCFDLAVPESWQRYAGDIRRLVSVNADWAERAGGIESFVSRVKPLVDIIAVHHELMEAELDRIIGLHPKDKVCVWTVNEEAALRHWLGKGLGYLTSDNPDLALRLRSGDRAAD